MLVSTVPLWVALLSPLTIKEPITRPVVVGMLLALLGGAIVGVSDSCAWQSGQFVCPSWADFVRGQAFLGDLLALVGAVTAAGYLLIGRRLRSSISLLSYVFLVYGMAGIVLVTLALGSGATFSGYAPQIYLWLALLALIRSLSVIQHNWGLGIYGRLRFHRHPGQTGRLNHLLFHLGHDTYRKMGAGYSGEASAARSARKWT
jgi:drug/metabolite transporter (DMT)-like permease